MKQFLLALAILLPLSAMAQRPDIRRNQVGNYPQQEKVVVVEGTNAVNKLRITTPSGKVLKAKGVRKAVSPLSQKTRYVVNLGELTTPGDYRGSCRKHRSLWRFQFQRRILLGCYRSLSPNG